MERFLKVVVCAALLSPLGAMAASSQNMGQVSAYLNQAEISGDGFSGDGTGFGVKGWFGFGTPFVHFEYETADIDFGGGGEEESFDQMRLGGGASFKASDAIIWYGKAEYVDFGGDAVEADGFGIHGGAIFLPGPAVNLHASLGYLDVSGDESDADGLEINVGAGFNFNKQWGAFIDYRTWMASFEDDGGSQDIDIDDLRIGGTYSWGM